MYLVCGHSSLTGALILLLHPRADALLNHKGGVQLMAKRQITSLSRTDDMILNFSPSHLLLTWVLYLFFKSSVVSAFHLKMIKL